MHVKGLLCPDELRVTLRYNETFSLTSTAGAGASYLFRGNGPFDPNQTGTGSQPTGYDQWSSFYQNQRTLGSKIRVRPMLTTATTYTAVGVCVAALPGNAAVNVTTDLANLQSQKFAKWNRFTLYEKAVDMKMKMSSAAILGKSVSAIEDDDTFGSVIGALPAVQWIWQIALQDQLANTTICTISVEVDYDIVFWGRTALTQS